MAFKENRSIKVYEGTSISRGNYYRGRMYKSQPQIRIQGDWLAELGFTSGTRMNVHCEKGKLILTAAEDDGVSD